MGGQSARVCEGLKNASKKGMDKNKWKLFCRSHPLGGEFLQTGITQTNDDDVMPWSSSIRIPMQDMTPKLIPSQAF